MTREAIPTPTLGMPNGPKRVIIHNYDHPVQQWAYDRKRNVMTEAGSPRYLPWVLFGSIWSRTDGYTVIRSRGDVVTLLPTKSIVKSTNLR